MVKPLQIQADWDDDSNVWVAISDDVPGLATEAETLEQLIEKLKQVARMQRSEIRDADAPDSARASSGLRQAGSATMRRVKPPRAAWNDFPEVLIHASESAVKQHPRYQAAKSGDAEAAVRLVEETINAPRSRLRAHSSAAAGLHS